MTQYSMGFFLREVTIHLFNSYRGRTPSKLIFDGNFISISGKNGAGKSSVIDALTFALFGVTERTEKGMKINEIIESTGFVEVLFEHAGKLLKVKRGRNKATSTLEVSVNGIVIQNKGITENEQYLFQILHMDLLAFTNSALIRQEEIKKFANAKAAERLDLLNQIFSLDVFDDAGDYCISQLKNLEQDKEDQERTLKEKQEKIMKDEQYKTELSQLKIDIEKILSEKEKFIQLSERSKVEQSELVSQISELQTKKSQQQQLKNEIGKKKKKIDDLKQYCKVDFSLGEKIKIEIDQIVKMKEQMPIIKLKETQINELRAELINKKKSFEHKYQGKILNRPPCTAKDMLEKYVKKEVIEVDVRSAYYYEFNEEILQEYKVEQEQIENGLLVSMKRISSEIQDIISHYQLKNQNELTLNQSLTELKEKERELIELKTKKDNADIEIPAITEEIVLLNNQIQLLDNDMLQLETLQKKLENCNNIIHGIEYKQQLLNESIGKMRERETQYKKTLLEIAELKVSIVAEETEYNQLCKEIQIYSILKDQVFHPRGLPFYTLQRFLNDLSIRASNLIYNLTQYRTDPNQRYQKITFSSQTEEVEIKKSKNPTNVLKKSARYGIKLEVDGNSIAKFSGGERTFIATAIRVAIAQKLCQMNNYYSQISTLIIDEGDLGSLDSEGARLSFVQLLSELKTFFKRIIIISHLEEVSQVSDQRINIVMENGSSKIL